MKRTKVLLIAALFLTGVSKTYAQDPNFSQYFMSPMTTNPASIGKGISDMRVMMNRKNQWWGSNDAAFTITTVSFEKQLTSAKLGEDQLGVGVMMLSDASNNGLLKNTYFSTGAAFNKKVGEYSTLGVGINFTYANRFLDVSKLQMQSQFGSMGFNSSNATNELIQITNAKYFDANGGIKYSLNEPTWGYSVGAAIFHSAKPRISTYNNSSYSLDQRINLQGSYYKKYRETDEFDLGFNFDAQGVNHVFSIGGLYKFQIPGNHLPQKLCIGIWDKFGYAIYPYVGLEAKEWSMGFTYDVITSDLNTYYNSVNSMEFSLAYQFRGKKDKKKPLTHVRMFEL